MISYKIVPNQYSKEQKEKHLKVIVDAAEKSGSEFFDPTSKRSNTKISVLSHSGEKTTIVIPDINTFFPFANVAVALNNQSKTPINYWYTYNGVEKWYYKYTIEKSDTTWNWQWSDYYTHHCMIIEIPIVGTGDSWFFVPAVIEFYYDLNNVVHVPITNVYYTRAKANNPPSFTDKVWTLLYENLYPDIRTLDFVYHFHVTITCHDDTIEWRS